MFQKINFLISSLLFAAAGCFGQNDTIPVKVQLDRSGNTDSLWINITVNNNPKPGSLLFVGSLENSPAKDSFYIPVIDSSSVICVLFPGRIRDNLLLQAFYTPGILTISGQVTGRKPPYPVKAVLITNNQQIFNKELVLKDENRFTLPPLVFQDKATIAFNYVNTDRKIKDHPGITINPEFFSTGFTKLVFSEKINHIDQEHPAKTARQPLPIGSMNPADSNYKTLHDVKVKTVIKSNVEKFNATYSTGLFNDAGERIIDCLDNDDILSYPDCVSYLQIKVPGLSVATEKFGNMGIRWHGHEMKAFYIDEMAVDIEQLLGVNTGDIAMIKVYSPPFFGSNGGGSGGAVALYTRHGEYRRPDADGHKWLFTIKGYAAPVHSLFE